jgi:hydroxymethylbilane synthase
VILAAAGLKRLGFAEKIVEYLDPVLSIPAIGQGALGLECRLDDTEIKETIAFFNHPETSHAVRAERALLWRCEGGVKFPSPPTVS